jgi:hypothetical protein
VARPCGAVRCAMRHTVWAGGAGAQRCGRRSVWEERRSSARGRSGATPRSGAAERRRLRGSWPAKRRRSSDNVGLLWLGPPTTDVGAIWQRFRQSPRNRRDRFTHLSLLVGPPRDCGGPPRDWRCPRDRGTTAAGPRRCPRGRPRDRGRPEAVPSRAPLRPRWALTPAAGETCDHPQPATAQTLTPGAET